MERLLQVGCLPSGSSRRFILTLILLLVREHNDRQHTSIPTGKLKNDLPANSKHRHPPTKRPNTTKQPHPKRTHARGRPRTVETWKKTTLPPNRQRQRRMLPPSSRQPLRRHQNNQHNPNTHGTKPLQIRRMAPKSPNSHPKRRQR